MIKITLRVRLASSAGEAVVVPKTANSADLLHFIDGLQTHCAFGPSAGGNTEVAGASSFRNWRARGFRSGTRRH